jgi:hypothetical protein
MAPFFSLEGVDEIVDIKTGSYDVLHLRVFFVSLGCVLKGV